MKLILRPLIWLVALISIAVTAVTLLLINICHAVDEKVDRFSIF